MIISWKVLRIWNINLMMVMKILNTKRNVVILNRRHNSTTRVLHVSFSGNMQSNIILNHERAWKSYRGMECDLNGFQSIRYVCQRPCWYIVFIWRFFCCSVYYSTKVNIGFFCLHILTLGGSNFLCIHQHRRVKVCNLHT